MIKLIASDIDGTLLPYGHTELVEGLFEVVGRLMRRGVRFCPASGRDINNLRKMFAPIRSEYCFICENGTMVYDRQQLVSRTTMPREAVIAIARDILAMGGGVFISRDDGEHYYCHMPDIEEFSQHVRFIDDPEEIEGNIIKITACSEKDILKFDRALRPRWCGRYDVALSGQAWLDFTATNKGAALRGLADHLGIGMDEVAAFGDNWNDRTMLEAAGTAYLMEGADDALRRLFPKSCRSVVEVLERLERGEDI